MHREPFQNQLRRSFIGYVAAILALILLLYLGGFALNFFAVVVRGCRRDNQELETPLTQQLAAYDRRAEELTGADALRRAVVRGDRGSVWKPTGCSMISLISRSCARVFRAARRGCAGARLQLQRAQPVDLRLVRVLPRALRRA